MYYLVFVKFALLANTKRDINHCIVLLTCFILLFEEYSITHGRAADFYYFLRKKSHDFKMVFLIVAVTDGLLSTAALLISRFSPVLSISSLYAFKASILIKNSSPLF